MRLRPGKVPCARLLLVAIAAAQLAACVAHKIEPHDPVPEATTAALRLDGGHRTTVLRLNEYPEGNHCFEPLLYVLTIGIIPTHCVERYHVLATREPPETNEGLATHFVVTSMQGWITGLLVLSPRWKFGYIQEPGPEIETILRLAETN